MVSICVFGDSIGEGCNDYIKGGWLEQLKRFYKIPNDEVFVYNCSIQGNSTREVLERFDIETKFREPTMIIFALGTNDSWYYENEKSETNVSTVDFENNLNKLIKKSKKLSVEIFFIGPPKVDDKKMQPVPWFPETYLSNDVLSNFNEIIKKVCLENEIKFIETFEVLNVEDLSDGVHPNTNGHIKLFEKIKKELPQF